MEKGRIFNYTISKILAILQFHLKIYHSTTVSRKSWIEQLEQPFSVYEAKSNNTLFYSFKIFWQKLPKIQTEISRKRNIHNSSETTTFKEVFLIWFSTPGSLYTDTAHNDWMELAEQKKPIEHVFPPTINLIWSLITLINIEWYNLLMKYSKLVCVLIFLLVSWSSYKVLLPYFFTFTSLEKHLLPQLTSIYFLVPSVESVARLDSNVSFSLDRSLAVGIIGCMLPSVA